MHIMGHMPFSYPPDSYSRELDAAVARQEMPYGYSSPPPSADTGDFDQKQKESNKEYPLKNGRAV